MYGVALSSLPIPGGTIIVNIRFLLEIAAPVEEEQEEEEEEEGEREEVRR